MRGHVAGDNGAGTDKRARPDPDAAEDHGTRADGCSVFHDRVVHVPIAGGLQIPRGRRGPWQAVVDEDDAVPDEHLVLGP